MPPVTVAADEVLARRLLARPQVAASQTELAWDDALRARTLRDMVGVPLMTGYLALVALVGALADGLAGVWAGNPSRTVGQRGVPRAPARWAAMVVVSQVIGPERHFRRRLWPDVPTSPPSLQFHADAARGRPMIIAVDPASHVPPFEQVRSQLAALADAGTLPPGHRLPTVRRMADDLGLATNTVARAYRELEQTGVVVTRGRHGTFVAVRGADVEREAVRAAAQYAKTVRELGVGADRAVALVREALAD